MKRVMDLIQREPNKDQGIYPDGKGKAARKRVKKRLKEALLLCGNFGMRRNGWAIILEKT